MPLHLRPSLLSSLHPPQNHHHHLRLPLTLIPLTHLRPASHAAQGRANKAAPGPGKRLGAKKSSQQYVVPGNIIFRQRGTHWFPGENCGMGRDHTIFAREKGYVVFYKDPEQLSLGVGGAGYGGGGGLVKGKRKVREKRRYIGVVRERGEVLPRGKGVPRRRRLGLEAREMSTLSASRAKGKDEEDGGFGESTTASDQIPAVEAVGGAVMRGATKEARSRVPEKKALEIRPGYMFREANWQIGRVEPKKGKKVRVYQKGDRFLAWRKRTRRLKLAAEKRMLRGKGKKRAGGR
ncbi:MAG: hypothetical protein Q9219_004339 [cf. Caloplaca sp. 3 TL-2023]